MKVDIYNTDKKYKIIYADPPWTYKTWTAKSGHKSASAHYPTMKKEDIQDMGNIIKRKNSNRDIYRNQIRKLQELKVEYYSLFYSTHLKRKMSALSLGLWKKKHSTRVM